MTTAGEDMGKQRTESSYLNQAKCTSETYENISPEQARITSVSPSNKYRNTTTQKMGGESVFKLLKHEILNAKIICYG